MSDSHHNGQWAAWIQPTVEGQRLPKKLETSLSLIIVCPPAVAPCA